MSPARTHQAPASLLRKSLKNERTVKLLIGSDSTPYYVHESVLTSISEYFVKAIKNQHLGTGERGTLRFPEDSEHAWQLLLHWKFNGSLPDINDLIKPEQQRQLIWLWVLADNYGIAELQDLAMLDLLQVLRYSEITADLVSIAFANTAPGALLRQVMAEEIVWVMRYSKDWENSNLDKLDGTVGFTTALVDTMQEFDEDEEMEDISERRFLDENGDRAEKWKEYMVGGGPKRHWIYEGEEDDEE